ncbi:MAG: 3-phosphoshikimate 1-carboxyvinyltransferase [Clostridiales bacterium]|jgi:3-phosphoshikimate 1-carboxyvinyltransferase|nr:3-phosphoshikimate 1-carboxyvinyltransferase [Clostridiales bacterium]
MTITLSGKSNVHAVVSVAGDKSISHRAIMLGAIADGVTEIDGFLPSQDCLSTISCFQKLGVTIERAGDRVRVFGNGLRGLQKPAGFLDVGNSGTTMRLMTGILAGQNFDCAITGDASIQKRPMERVFAPLRQMGARFSNNSTAPFTIYGSTLRGIEYTLPVASAQVKSAILLAGLYAEGVTTVVESVATRNHTELMLNMFGGKICKREQYSTCAPVSKLIAQKVSIPSDISSAAFFIVAGLLIPDSEITIERVGVNHTRTGILDSLAQMGADISINNRCQIGGEPVADITARASRLRGISLGPDIIPRMIDEAPVFAVAAVAAQGQTIITGAQELKYKESNRIGAMAAGLAKMGANIVETDDGMIINGGAPLRGATVMSHNDHRVAMSIAVAASIASGRTRINDADCVDISFPGFFELWRKL